MAETSIYLDTYILQQDMRVRLPKSILSNLDIEKGKTKFDIFIVPSDNSLVLRVHKEKEEAPIHE